MERKEFLLRATLLSDLVFGLLCTGSRGVSRAILSMFLCRKSKPKQKLDLGFIGA